MNTEYRIGEHYVPLSSDYCIATYQSKGGYMSAVSSVPKKYYYTTSKLTPIEIPPGYGILKPGTPILKGDLRIQFGSMPVEFEEMPVCVKGLVVSDHAMVLRKVTEENKDAAFFYRDEDRVIFQMDSWGSLVIQLINP